MDGERLLKISALAEEAGVSVATVKHYLREGLLPEPERKSRNMAYYPGEYVNRIALIKRLQEERFMPLKEIRRLLDEDFGRIEAVLEIEDRILARTADAGREPISPEEANEVFGMPLEVLERLESIGILRRDGETYGPLDVKIIEAISRFRAGGYDERIGFTVYDTLRYRQALEDLVSQEVELMMSRLAGEVEPERVVEMLEAGAQPLEDLIAALHTKLLLEELERRRRERRAGGPAIRQAR